jgi:LmbE family N-acetylglucosaminyl deacetylase
VTAPDAADALDAPRPSPLPGGGAPAGAIASVDLAVPARALAIGAHPDDVEFLCGSTLAKWAAKGCIINHLVLTDGSKGTWDADADTAALVAQREDEQLEAARRLGSRGKVVMLGHVDGELQADLEVRDQVAYWIRALRPDVVLAHDPWKRYRLHPDHRHAGWAALDGVVAARDPHFLRHHDVPHHRPTAVLLFEADEPDHVEAVDGFVDTKVDALLAHRSQFITTHDIPDGDDGEAAAAFRARIHDRAAAVGATAGVSAGEAFKALTEL